MYQLSLRTGLALGMLFLLLVSPCIASAGSGAVVRLEPEVLALRPGETGEVVVRVEGVADLAGAEVHLEYDADLLEVVDADPGTEGVQIGHGGFLAADFVVQNRVDPEAGRIDYAVAQMPPHEPVGGDGPLARVVLRAQGEGEGAVVLQTVLLADSAGNAIPIEVAADQTTVAVESPPARPCPPAGALFLGALGLGWIARSRRAGSDGRPTFAQGEGAG